MAPVAGHGPSGIGKTALLDYAAGAAHDTWNRTVPSLSPWAWSCRAA